MYGREFFPLFIGIENAYQEPYPEFAGCDPSWKAKHPLLEGVSRWSKAPVIGKLASIVWLAETADWLNRVLTTNPDTIEIDFNSHLD